MEPAISVINKFGGIDAVARIVGRSTVSVRRWAYSKASGGQGGLIPAEHQVTLLRHAKETDMTFDPSELLPAEVL